MTSRPITTMTTQVFRPILLGLLLVLILAPLGGAGDPDDDWGLPAMPASDKVSGGAQGTGGGSNSSQSATAESAPELPTLGLPLATHLDGALSSTEGMLIVSAQSAAPLGAESASVTALGPAGASDAATVSLPGGSMALQGAASVQSAANHELTLQAPSFFGMHSAFLVFDDGEVASLSELLHTAEGRSHITGMQALGVLTQLDVTRTQQLVDSQAGALGEQRVSVVIVSLEFPLALGTAHVTGVRMAPDAPHVELLTD